MRPERTIVREVDELLPTLLAGVALSVALGGVAYSLARTRPRRATGRAH